MDNFRLVIRMGRVALVSGAGTVINDLSYFRRRASEERTAALNSRDVRVRRVHVTMAEAYEERVRGMTAHHERIYFPLVETA